MFPVTAGSIKATRQLPWPIIGVSLMRTEVVPIHLWQQIETNLDVRTGAASGVIVIGTLILLGLAEKFAGLTQQMR
jgi:hypothetical protein